MPRLSTSFVLAILILVIHFGGPVAVFAESDQTHTPAPIEAPELRWVHEGTSLEPVLESSDEPPWMRFTISVAQEAPVVIEVPEGGLATYRSTWHGVSFGVIAELENSRDGDTVQIQLVSIIGERPRYRPEKVLESFQGRLGFQVVGTANTSLPIAIKVELANSPTSAVSAASRSGTDCQPPGASPRPPTYLTGALPTGPGGGGGTCCVTCNGGEWCGCTVTTPCGSCTGDC